MANQAKVSHADFSFKQSCQSRTPVTRSIDKPTIAVTALAMPIASLHKQRNSFSINQPSELRHFFLSLIFSALPCEHLFTQSKISIDYYSRMHRTYPKIHKETAKS